VSKETGWHVLISTENALVLIEFEPNFLDCSNPSRSQVARRDALHLQGVRSIDLIDAPMCGCMMRAMASSGQGSERLNGQLLVDSIPALIHTARPDGYLDYFNKPWLEYLGVTLDKVTGWNRDCRQSALK
jgi:hypothetical protein